jgi:5-methylthioadenosine/S-adenosylhomocysteine deaminase
MLRWSRHVTDAVEVIHAGLALLEVDGDLVVARDVLIHLDGGVIEAIAVDEPEPPMGVTVFDARDRLVLPGLVNMHSHAGLQTKTRMRSDSPDPQAFSSGFLEVAPVGALTPPVEDLVQVARWTLLEHMLAGTTTVVDVGLSYDFAVALVEQNQAFGLRLHLGVAAASRRYNFDEDGILTTAEVDQPEEVLIEQSRSLAALCATDPHASVTIVPMQVECCSDELLLALRDLADEVGAPIHTHCAQNLVEIHESFRRFGRSSIQRLDELGLLREGTVLGHCVYPDANPLTGVAEAKELEILARSGVTVAHCPTVMSRLGLRGFGVAGWTDAGINVALGTDSYPRDLLAELRAALAYSRLVGLDARNVTAKELFDSATRWAGRALCDERLGRLAVGAVADVCTVALDDRDFGGVVFDPVRQLVELGSHHVVRDVIVDGKVQVEAGQPRVGPAWDRGQAVDRAASASRYFEGVGEWRPGIEDAWDAFGAVTGSSQVSRFLSDLPPG